MADMTNTTRTLSGSRPGFLDRWITWYANRVQQRLDRQAFKTMLYLDDDALRDIGVSRADVEWAAGLPLHKNASQELRAIGCKTAMNF